MRDAARSNCSILWSQKQASLPFNSCPFLSVFLACSARVASPSSSSKHTRTRGFYNDHAKVGCTSAAITDGCGSRSKMKRKKQRRKKKKSSGEGHRRPVGRTRGTSRVDAASNEMWTQEMFPAHMYHRYRSACSRKRRISRSRPPLQVSALSSLLSRLFRRAAALSCTITAARPPAKEGAHEHKAQD
jgi:hypothetical protein